MIADSVDLHVFHRQGAPHQSLELSDRLVHRYAVPPSAADVVDRRDAGRAVEEVEEAAQIERVDVVADLFSLVAVDPISAPLFESLGDVGEKSVQLGGRVTRPGQTAAAKAGIPK